MSKTKKGIITANGYHEKVPFAETADNATKSTFATSATKASSVDLIEINTMAGSEPNEDMPVLFVPKGVGNATPQIIEGLTYNPATGTLKARNFEGRYVANEVTKSEHADTADRATVADRADYADTADRATVADRADYAVSADEATTSTTASELNMTVYKTIKASNGRCNAALGEIQGLYLVTVNGYTALLDTTKYYKHMNFGKFYAESHGDGDEELILFYHADGKKYEDFSGTLTLYRLMKFEMNG